LKRLAAVAAALAALCIGAGSAGAGGNGASITLVPVSFVDNDGLGLSTRTCPNMPAVVTIKWSGLEKQILTSRTDAGGVTTVSVVSHASGKATDQSGNSYAFDYSNAFRVANTTANQNLFSGTMTDHFSLAGPGLNLSNGFIATFKTDLVENFYDFVPINSRGDPISFPDAAPRCDPL